MTNGPLVMGLLWDLLRLFGWTLSHQRLRLTVRHGSFDGTKHTTLEGVSLLCGLMTSGLQGCQVLGSNGRVCVRVCELPV